MARIGGSVYSDVKAEDYYQTQAGPSPMMKASLIYNLVNFRLDPSVSSELVLVLVSIYQCLYLYVQNRENAIFIMYCNFTVMPVSY
jgi:hypothetical protein